MYGVHAIVVQHGASFQRGWRERSRGEKKKKKLRRRRKSRGPAEGSAYHTTPRHPSPTGVFVVKKGGLDGVYLILIGDGG